MVWTTRLALRMPLLWNCRPERQHEVQKTSEHALSMARHVVLRSTVFSGEKVGRVGVRISTTFSGSM